MAQVPYVPYPTERPGGPATPAVRVNPGPAFGENIGHALAGVAKGMGDMAAGLDRLGRTEEAAGDEIFKRALAIQQLNNETEAREADARYMITAGKLHADYSAKQGKDAVDAFPKYQQDLQQARIATRDALSNPMAQKMYDSSSLSTMGRSIFNGAGHAATQNKQWAIGTAKAQIDLDAKTVSDSPQDDVLFQEKLNRTRANVANLSALQGYEAGGPQEKDLGMKAVSQIWAQRITGLSRTSPNDAAVMLDKNKAQMTEGDFLKVDNSVRSQSHSIASVNIANQVYQEGQETDKASAKPLKQMEDEVRAKAKEQFPDDPLMPQKAVQALQGRYNQDKYAARQEEVNNYQTVQEAFQKGAKDIQELRLDPKVAAAIDALPKDKQNAIPGQINRYNAARDKVTNEESRQRLFGLSNNDPEAFLNTDLTKEHLSQTDMKSFQVKQQKMKDNLSGDPRVNRAVGQMRGALGSQMQALGIYKRTDSNKDDYDHFTGALQSAIDVWTDTHSKPPSYDDIVTKIGPQVLQLRKEPGWLWDSKKPFYDQPVPAKWAEELKADITAKGGAEPTDEQIARAYIRYQTIKLYGGKKESK